MTGTSRSAPQTIDDLAEAMHDAYEVEAIRAGWDTNPASRVPWDDVPEANKQAMRAGVLAVLDALYEDGWRKTRTTDNDGGERG